MKKLLVVILPTLFCVSCVTCIFPPVADNSYSTVTFVKNTLDYPVLVQCYFRPFNDNPSWRENELIEYSEPVEIQPNEYKIVMDYVKPCGMKIFRATDNALLFDSFDLRDPYSFSDMFGTIFNYSFEEAKKLSTVEGNQIAPKEWCEAEGGSPSYFIQDEKYLFENVPWSLYPIYFEYNACDESTINEMDEHRKTQYKIIANGYAFVDCITLNKDAECFK